MLWFITIITLAAIDGIASHVRTLSPEEVERLNSWNEDSLQNIWQLSGQFQGDIVIDPSRNGLQSSKSRWPNGELPYEITEAFDQNARRTIEDALRKIEEKSCIRFRPRRSSDRDYVRVTAKSTGCNSYVGRQFGAQGLNLQLPGCLHQRVIIHEFMHALGFHHQHCATDRDHYVTIVYQNVIPGWEYAFNKQPGTTSFGEKYDYASIMHYDAYAFSKNGQKTILTKDPNAVIGKGDTLSRIDAAKLNKMYMCRNLNKK